MLTLDSVRSGKIDIDFYVQKANLGGVYYYEKDYERASNLWTESLNGLRKILGDNHTLVGTLYQNMSSVYQENKNYSLAIEYGNKALEIMEALLGEKHPQVATIYSNNASIYEDQKDFGTAIELHKQALERFKNAFGENSQGSLNVAAENNAIGKCYDKLNDFLKAEEAFKKGLEIEKGIFDTPNIYLYRANTNLAWLYYNYGHYEKSREYFAAGREIIKTLYGEKDGRYVNDGLAICNSYILDYNKSKSEATLKLYNDYISERLVIMSLAEGDTPATRQGLSGEYILLEFENWKIGDISFISDEVTRLQGKPKTLVLMKDGIISSHHFDNAIGGMSYMKDVSREERNNVMKIYKKWKKKNK